MMLIFGVHWEIRRLVGYYVTTSMVLLVLQFILMVLIFVFMGLIAALPLLTWGIILFFFIIVVRSVYLDMEDREKPLVCMIYDTSTLRCGQMQQPLMSSSSSSRPYPSYMKFDYHSVQ
ncbi:uncharacterized protein LOC113239684 isoform X2 [Hyposmocoma kahamanoa]|nr:uncharacterized protein LOC113239684 isoform X2 [Hyposmocoma kahamanoa]